MTAKIKDFFRFVRPAAQNIYARPPLINFALINITYFVTDSDGVRQKVTTWATGETAVGAAEKWKRRRSDIPRKDVSYVIVSEGRVKVKRDLVVGSRVEVEDRLMTA